MATGTRSERVDKLRELIKNGKDDPNIGLIKVKVYQAEYWEAPYGVATKLLGFARAVTTGDRSGLGENRKLDLNK